MSKIIEKQALTQQAEPSGKMIEQIGVNGNSIENPLIRVSNDFSFWYGKAQVLFDLNLDIPNRKVTALIGPSGCGKSTLLRCFNRMNDLIEGIHHTGDISINNQSIFDTSLEIISLRKKVGMVFQKYNPFPKSIYENVVFSLRVSGRNKKSLLDETVERSLKRAALWGRSEGSLA